MTQDTQVATRAQTALASPAPQQAQQWWQPKTFDEAFAMAERFANSELVPPDYRKKPDSILVAWSLGAPLGLTLLSSVQHISVVNGRPSIWGDAALAVCKAFPLCDDVNEEIEGEGDAMVARCTAVRRGSRPVVREFSVADAKKAGLWAGAGVRDPDKRSLSPWVKYPKRMLQMRARSWALRDAFPDALCGMPITEELRDITDEVTVTTAAPEPQGATATERLKNRLRPPAEEPAAESAAAATDANLSPEDQREDLLFRFKACVHQRSEGDDEKAARVVEEIEACIGKPVEELPTDELAKLVASMEAKVAGKKGGGK